MQKKKGNNKRRSFVDPAKLSKTGVGRRGQGLAARTARLIPADLAARRSNKRFTAEELKKLKIDERYQRWRIASSVGWLVGVIESGGHITTPILVAKRKDGTYWIIDGQQRWWAAYHTNTGLDAQVFEDTTLEEERLLFTIYNSQTHVTGGFRIHGSAGPSGEMMRKLATDKGSPLNGLMGWEPNAQPYPAALVFRAFVAAMLGSKGSRAAIEHLLGRLDIEIQDGKKLRAEKVLLMVATVIRQVFSEKERAKIRSLPATALGLACHRHWEKLGVRDAWPTPSARQCDRIRNLNWLVLAPDQKSIRVPTLVNSILHIWPVKKARVIGEVRRREPARAY